MQEPSILQIDVNLVLQRPIRFCRLINGTLHFYLVLRAGKIPNVFMVGNINPLSKSQFSPCKSLMQEKYSLVPVKLPPLIIFWKFSPPQILLEPSA